MADDGKLDTGTGGFSVDGDLHNYDVGVKQDVPLAKPIPWDSGDVKVDQEQKDLSKVTKRTLASYLSKTTMGTAGTGGKNRAPNAYPITHNPSSDPIDSKLTDSFGSPISPTPTQNDAAFSPKLPETKSVAAANLNFRKGREHKSGDVVDGNDLLRQAPDPKSEVAKYTNALIKNRFGTTYTAATTANQLGLKQFATEYKLGTSEVDPAKEVSFGQLAQVGTVLSIRSGVELTSTSDGVNPSSIGTEAAAILPGAAQLGLARIQRELLDAHDVLRSLTAESISENQLISPASNSWGALNNSLDQFSGASNTGMQLLALSLIAAMGVTFGSLSFFMGLVKPTVYQKRDAQGRLPLGASEGRSNGLDMSSPSAIAIAVASGDFNFWSMIGVRPTANPLNDAMTVGALAFFGIDGKNFGSALTTSVSAAAQNPGFDAIVARSVTRSFLQIGDAMSTLVKSFRTNAVSGVKQLFNLIDVFRGSKFIGAINVFAQLGDQILLANLAEIDSAASNGSGRRTSTMDYLPNVNAQTKSRLKGTMHLAWSSYRSPDMLIMPTSLANAQAANNASLAVPSLQPAIASDGNAIGLGAGLKRDLYTVTDKGRIPTDVREQMESALDAEYVPFYFHDIRTNEIVSFHAFLAGLTDGFAASYEASEGYGRVEAIKTYKSTARKLAFSFYVAATSPQDFDSMWLKINKITTLMYPQFTEGKSIVSTDYKIRAPFSQLIGAPPMCRVRIGDLITSNYSKFNLARLFGYSYKDTMFGDAGLSNLNSDVQEVYQNALSEELKKSKSTAGKSFFIAAIQGNSIPDPVSSDVTNIEYNVPHPTGLVADINSDLETGDLVRATVLLATSDDDPSLTDQAIQNARARYGNVNDKNNNVLGKQFIFQKSSLIPTPSIIKEASTAARKKAGIPDSSYATNAADFMNDAETGKGNVISKSFRSVGGRGLAGFIESMDFDWYDKVTWAGIGEGDNVGKRAPKMVKVNITFAPIHDITPGLDHEGSNRAPIYQVGPFSTKGR